MTLLKAREDLDVGKIGITGEFVHFCQPERVSTLKQNGHGPPIDCVCTHAHNAGVSLGGMHAWLAAAYDERISAAAPMIVSVTDGVGQHQ